MRSPATFGPAACLYSRGGRNARLRQTVTALSERSEALALDALSLAVDRGVSGYDAMYLALAEATDAVLVTADRRLAAAATRSELLD